MIIRRKSIYFKFYLSKSRNYPILHTLLYLFVLVWKGLGWVWKLCIRLNCFSNMFHLILLDGKQNIYELLFWNTCISFDIVGWETNKCTNCYSEILVVPWYCWVGKILVHNVLWSQKITLSCANNQSDEDMVQPPE